MSPEAACWQKLKDRRTLVNNEHCLLDLDSRLQAIESQINFGAHHHIQPDAKSGNGSLAGITSTSDATATPVIEDRPQDISPIPVSARLPELHELDRQGRCWAYRSTTHEPLGRAWVLGTPVSLQLTRSWCSFTHWLPHWCLPVVEEINP
jgi:hypothetical protein